MPVRTKRFGEIVAECRQNTGYSREQIAEHLGIDIGLLPAIEQVWIPIPSVGTTRLIGWARPITQQFGVTREALEAVIAQTD
jgi:transcriptional regulator with XRE-family HTH domain